MTNKSSFGISTKNKSNLVIKPYNPSASFNIRLYNRSIFSLVIQGFNLVDKYIISFASKSSLGAVLKSITKMGTTINSKVNLTFTELRERLLASTSIESHVILGFVIRSGGLFSFVLSSISNLGVFLKQLMRNIIDIGNTNVNLYFSSGVKDYNTLAYFDTMTLVEMDAFLLKELDYDIPHLPLLDDDGKTLIDDDGLTLIG